MSKCTETLKIANSDEYIAYLNKLKSENRLFDTNGNVTPDTFKFGICVEGDLSEWHTHEYEYERAVDMLMLRIVKI